MCRYIMKKSTKKISLILLLIVILSSACLCACDNDLDSDCPPKIKYPKYETFYCNLKRIYINDGMHQLEGDIVIAKSVSDLQYYDILDTKYTDEFFESNVVLMIAFKYDTAEGNIEFKNLALKDGKFYPIFELDTQEILCEEENRNLYLIECGKSILDYDYADILTVNRLDMGIKSAYYDSITEVFK